MEQIKSTNTGMKTPTERDTKTDYRNTRNEANENMSGVRRSEILIELFYDYAVSFMEPHETEDINYNRLREVKRRSEKIPDYSVINKYESDLHSLVVMVEQIYQYGKIIMDDPPTAEGEEGESEVDVDGSET